MPMSGLVRSLVSVSSSTLVSWTVVTSGAGALARLKLRRLATTNRVRMTAWAATLMIQAGIRRAPPSVPLAWPGAVRITGGLVLAWAWGAVGRGWVDMADGSLLRGLHSTACRHLSS